MKGAMVTGMRESAGEQVRFSTGMIGEQSGIFDSISLLVSWLEKNEYRGYDTFDGLSAKFLRPLAFENKYLLIALQQGVRRFPLNLRPFLGIEKGYSSKGMGFLARGFLRLSKATGDQRWVNRATFCLKWLIDHQAPGYSGACWGNHFDYVSRTGRIPKGMPTIVWTSLIGHAFLDAYEHLRQEQYLQIAVSTCEHILRDLTRNPEGSCLCIGYTPGSTSWVHNANTLGAGFLARTYSHTGSKPYKELAQQALAYTAKHQRPDGSWFYGEKWNLHWVDNFHTGYVLDCFKHYTDSTQDLQFEAALRKGYQYWKRTFFLDDGTPRYYSSKTLPLDIQCAAQGIDTLLFFSNHDPEAVQLALKVAKWTVKNMQDKTGYFYYRRYSRWVVNRTPTLHWGQATMLCALGGLYQKLCNHLGHM